MHTQGQVIAFIEKCFGPVLLAGNNLNVGVACPECPPSADTSKRKLAIRTDNFLTKCWVCGYRSRSIVHLLKTHHPNHLQEFIDLFAQHDAELLYDEDLTSSLSSAGLNTMIELPQGFTLLAEQFWNTEAPLWIRQVKSYLLNRGLTYRDFWYYKFGATIQDPRYQNRVIIPSHNVEGELNFFTSRAIIPGLYPKYQNPFAFVREEIIFNEINIDWTSELTLVEGPFDLVKANENATCLLGSDLTPKYRLFQKIVEHSTPVLLACDDDAVTKTYRMAQRLTEYTIPVRVLEMPKSRHDVGEMSKEEFLALISTGVPYDSFEYLKGRIAKM